MTAPRAVECKRAGYPNTDADGDKMYDNTHFANEAEAWKQLRQEREAHVRISGGTVAQAKRELQRAEQSAAFAAELYAQFCEAAETAKKATP
jgi:hypothetical protein